ncbi:MAG: MFS transporter [Gammaproteobacteria bacterium]
MRHPRVLITLLGCAQIVSWGALYYAFSLFVLPMQVEFGWSLTAVNGALSCGLLVAGLCAYPVGTLIDRRGGRIIMGCGALAGALLLLAWSSIDSLPALYLVWIGLGVAMAAVLYEPLFIVLAQHFGDDARRAITALTLIAGFASTVFMPLVETLLASLDWRAVLRVLAACMLAVSLPINALCVPRRGAHRHSPSTGAEVAAERAAARAALAGYLRTRLFAGLALWFTAWAGTASAVMFQLVPYLKHAGVDHATLLLTVALVGPSQVAGRLLLMLGGERLGTTQVGALVTTLLPLALLVLTLAPPTAAWLALFAVLFGCANGVTTILRGVVPAEWLGRVHLGRVMGALGTPMMVAMAVAPSASAALWVASDSPRVMQLGVFALALSGSVGFWLAVTARR